MEDGSLTLETLTLFLVAGFKKLRRLHGRSTKARNYRITYREQRFKNSKENELKKKMKILEEKIKKLEDPQYLDGGIIEVTQKLIKK